MHKIPVHQDKHTLNNGQRVRVKIYIFKGSDLKCSLASFYEVKYLSIHVKLHIPGAGLS